MNRLIFLLSIFCLVWEGQLYAQSENETADLFKTKCGICHTIGGGKLVGPDLANVQDKRSEDWLLTYIRSSQTMIKGGDPDAVALFKEFNEVIMPDPMISDTEIKSLIGYIAENSGGGVGTADNVSVIGNATPEDFQNGKDLFEGRVRFANGGPSCYSCHNDLSTVFFSENSYSTKDISTSFTNLGERGVKAILSNPSFPVMAKAFEKHPLEEEEIHDLLIFLKDAGSTNNKIQPASGYILYGLLGSGALIILLGGLWYNRKSKSVNHSIYQRQIKSTN